jgi:hypothetical protein
MKQVLCAVTLILGLAAGSVAKEGDFWLGVRGGPSVPNLSGGGNEVSEGYSSIVTPNFGLVADYFLTDHWAVQVEANYSGQGGERDGMQPITQSLPGLPTLPPGQYFYANFQNKSVLTYFEIPVLAKYQGALSEHWRFFGQAGPYVGFLLHAEQETSGSSVVYADRNGTSPLTPGPVSFNANTDVKDKLRDVNVGITAGLGLAYVLGERHQVFLDIRGQYGFIPLQRNTDVDGESHTGAVLFLLGYMFRLGS